nr:cytochrome P450 [Streptomyces clavuligerus]
MVSDGGGSPRSRNGVHRGAPVRRGPGACGRAVAGAGPGEGVALSCAPCASCGSLFRVTLRGDVDGLAFCLRRDGGRRRVPATEARLPHVPACGAASRKAVVMVNVPEGSARAVGAGRREEARGVPDGLPAPPVAPGRLPVLGHLVAMLRDPLGFMASLPAVAEVVTIYVGTRPVHVANSLDLVQSMLVTEADSFQRGLLFEKAEKVVGPGLTMVEGEAHRRQRKLVQPAFSPRRIEQYTQTMIEAAEAGVGSWRPGRRMDADRVMYDLGMDVFTRVLFRGALDGASADLVKQATSGIMAGMVAHSLYPAQWLEKVPIPLNRRFRRGDAQMTEVVDRIIHHYRQGGTADHDGAAILDALMAENERASGRPLDSVELRTEVIHLLVAGAEGPGASLAWLFHELSRHPDVERQLVEELDAVFGDGPLTVAGLAGLTFTRAVVKESLRVHAPTWLLTRRALKAVALGGHRIPAGGEVAFSLTALHRTAPQYDDPGRFDPARWLDGRTARLPRSAYMPFGTGRHRCVGDHFTLQVVLVCAVTIARRWRLVPCPGIRVRERPVALVRPSGLLMDVAAR